MKKKLSLLQDKFCMEYVKTGFQGQAYINAGYKAKNKIIAEANARLLLRNPKVKKRIEELYNAVKSPKIADIKEVLELLTVILRGETQEEVILTKKDGKNKTEIITIKKQVSASERIRAAELLGKRYKIFSDKIVIDDNVPILIIDNIEN